MIRIDRTTLLATLRAIFYKVIITWTIVVAQDFDAQYTEYEKSIEKLGDVCTTDWWEQFDKRRSPYFDMLCEILGDLPMVRILSSLNLLRILTKHKRCTVPSMLL